MRRIDDLIAKYCPNGVEYKELCRVLDYEQPSKYLVQSTNYTNDTNLTPVLTAGQTFLLGYTDENVGIYKASQDNPVIIFDDFTTANRWVDFSFKVKSSAIKLLKPKGNDNLRYMYYVMNSIKYSTQEHSRQWISKYSKILIPVPPLPVQQEIVRILDSFSELEKELEKELETREKQYEYYRNQLLSFGEGGSYTVNWRNLDDVCYILDSQRKPITKSDRKAGAFPYYGANGVQDYVADYLFDGVFLLVGEDGSVINPDKSPVLNWAVGKIWVNNHAHVLSEKPEVALLRYVYFVLSEVDVSGLVRGIPPKLNQQNLKSIRIPVPSLPEQERIVAILDKFDALVNDISIGLPAEIDARRKQYEYYREKLLTFPKVSCDA